MPSLQTIESAGLEPRNRGSLRSSLRSDSQTGLPRSDCPPLSEPEGIRDSVAVRPSPPAPLPPGARGANPFAIDRLVVSLSPGGRGAGVRGECRRHSSSPSGSPNAGGIMRGCPAWLSERNVVKRVPSRPHESPGVRVARRAEAGGRLFFAYFLLAKQKKVSRLSGRTPDIGGEYRRSLTIQPPGRDNVQSSNPAHSAPAHPETTSPTCLRH